MKNIIKILLLLVIILGLGVPCVSAANLYLNPQTVELNPDSSQDVQLVMDSVPMGLSGFKITLSVSDPTIAQISAVSFPNWATLNSSSTLPSGSVWIKAADLSNQVLPGNTNVMLGTITIVGKKAGATDLSILPEKISDDNGTSINPTVITGKVHVSGNNLPILPVANFSSNVNSGYAPLSVKFTDLSKNATGWRWTFGDGTSSKQQSPTHVYKTAGTFNVILTVNNTNGTNSKQATINVYNKPTPVLPVANFSSNVNSGYAPLSVKFTDLSKNATRWKWTFGDGTSSTQQSPTHVYYTEGIYTVILTVKNKNGTDSKLATINVTIRPPVASFTASRTYGYHPLIVIFTDTSKGQVSSRKWDFGDGRTSTKSWVIHPYIRRGTYICNLTVGNLGGSSTASKTITVR